MGKRRFPGPVCTVLNDWFEIDPGSHCVNPSLPGPVTSPAAIPEAEVKANCLSHARQVSYLMQAKTLLPGEHGSWLGGAFLRMYLDHKVDNDSVQKAGEEIKASKVFQQLEKDTNVHIQAAADRHAHMLSGKEIATEARGYLQARKKKKGIAFRGALNPVIGGVGGVDVGPEAVTKSEPQAGGLTVLEYEIQVTFSDVYNFENRRVGEYEAYRKYLADLLRRNKFHKFNQVYRTEVLPIESWHHTKTLDSAALFASFMYALEKRGWTPGGLAWQVTIAMRGKLQSKPLPRPHAHSKK